MVLEKLMEKADTYVGFTRCILCIGYIYVARKPAELHGSNLSCIESTHDSADKEVISIYRPQINPHNDLMPRDHINDTQSHDIEDAHESEYPP